MVRESHRVLRSPTYYDAITWKLFSQYWAFAGGNNLPPLSKGPMMQSIVVSLLFPLMLTWTICSTNSRVTMCPYYCNVQPNLKMKANSCVKFICTPYYACITVEQLLAWVIWNEFISQECLSLELVSWYPADHHPCIKSYEEYVLLHDSANHHAIALQWPNQHIMILSR